MTYMNDGVRDFAQENLYTQSLYSISRITSRLNQHHILQPILSVIRRVVPVDALGVYVVSEDKRFVERFSLISGHRQVIPGQGHKMAFDDSALAQLAAENDNYIYRNLALGQSRYPLDQKMAVQAGVRCAAAVSICGTETVCGSVVFDSYVPHRYDADHLPFFQQVAELIGIYLENQRLLQQSLLAIEQDASQKGQLDLIAKLKGEMKWQLTDIALRADHLSCNLQPNLKFRRELQILNQQATGLLAELRSTIAHVDKQNLTGSSLPDVLVDKLQQFENQTGLRTRWGMIGTPVELSASVCEVAHDFLQEALHNCRVLLQAHLVKVQLLWQQDRIVIELEDDGRGFNADHIKITDKLGANLHRMSARANQLGGTLTIHSIAGWGTRLTLMLPTHSALMFGRAPRQNLMPTNNDMLNVVVLGADEDGALTTLLTHCPDARLAGLAVDSEGVLNLLRQVYPDVILIEENASEAIITDLLTALQTLPSAPPVIILNKQRDWLNMAELTQVNVQFYDGEDLETDSLKKLLETVVQGKSISQAAVCVSDEDESEGNFVEALSDREQEILDLVSQGLSNQEIADQLVLQESTVRWHMHNIMQKLAAKSRTHAVRIALEHGLLLSV